MQFIAAFVLAIISSMVINNVILSKFLGICSFIGVGNKVKPAFSMGLAVLFVMTLASAITWPIYNFILIPAQMTYMKTVIFILVIASLVQAVGYFIKKKSPALYKSLGIYLPLITTNCAVLGMANEVSGLDFGMAMANTIGGACGFILVMVLFACIRQRLDGLDVPKAFKGVPIALVTAGLMALAFSGFAGMI